MNEELASINQWSTSNKLSLNANKTKYSFFHKPSKKDDIPLMLPKLTISNHVIERQEFIKFLGVLLDENLNWKEHIKYTENKIAKNLGLLYKARPFLERNALLALYYSYIQTYINYANIAWGSTCRTNLKKLTANKNMQYVLFLIKTSLRTQGKSLRSKKFKYIPVKHFKQHHIHASCRKYNCTFHISDKVL